MNKKYDNNNIIIASRAYFLQRITLNGYGFPLLVQKKNRFGYLRIKDR
jgi:hypothetical protein